MRKIPWLQSRISTVLFSVHATNAWEPRQKGTVCFDDVEESRSDRSNWRGKTHRIRMEIEQQPPGAKLVSRKVCPETLGASRRDDATTHMDDAASHTGDVATHADDDTNRTVDPRDDVDDMEMVETTSTDGEFESAWREDSDDSAEEDP